MQLIHSLVVKHLPEGPFEDPSSEEDFYLQLRQRVNYLLDHDMAGLLQALYRMDVSETLVKEVFATATAEELADKLIVLIIHRAEQKLETRKKYSDSAP